MMPPPPLGRGGLGLRPRLGPARPGRSTSYAQGQSPEPRTREYFYYINHQGQLFLDDAKVKNFITCFKDRRFLVFFFSRLRLNRSGRYEESFPYLSPCGRERNFVRCEDRPVVFTRLLDGAAGCPPRLSFCGGGGELAVPFEPAKLLPLPDNGRLYHPAPGRLGRVGLVGSALASELSPRFRRPPAEAGDPGGTPTHFFWEGRCHPLTRELMPLLRTPGTPRTP
ncbi:UPF0598 protein C8orf82 homolog [Ornithorhynchus anatinus]|uniref:Chromosome 8 open reading frame 82 n=1 Tax=Ornithorhynchus anatinus TaxID=9258 RepID=A0A6I8NV16_ORNAN|nr:UPF0598 protein C8orf82 homolog [Ornithorhynchus anatinus]